MFQPTPEQIEEFKRIRAKARAHSEEVKKRTHPHPPNIPRIGSFAEALDPNSENV